MCNQLICTIRDRWRLAEYKAESIANVLNQQIESVANVDAELLKDFIWNADSTIAVPVFNYQLLGGHFELQLRDYLGCIDIGARSDRKQSIARPKAARH